MTKKDYIILAESIKQARATADFGATSTEARTNQCAIDQVVSSLCKSLANQNPRFDAARFAAACNQEGK